MSHLNLWALAAEVVSDSMSPDPGIIAEELVSRIGQEHYREALVYMARDLVTSVIHDRRREMNGGPPNANGSRKVAAARDAWKRLLDTPEFVPSVGWIFLRDATHTQVLEMAGARKKKSIELADAAKRYSALAKEMQVRSVMRVADLPDDVLGTLLDETRAA